MHFEGSNLQLLCHKVNSGWSGGAHGIRVPTFRAPLCTTQFDIEIVVFHSFTPEHLRITNIRSAFSFSFLTTFFSVLHYGPFEGSIDGSEVLTYLQHPFDIWDHLDPEDPLSLVDQVFKCCKTNE